MSQPDLDENEKKRRKEQIVAWREKRRVSTVFMLVASLFEIIETLLIIVGLFLISSVFFLKILDSQKPAVQLAYEISIVVVFVAGIVIGFLVYKKVIGWVIQKFGWKDKLSDDVIMHYVKKSKEETESELKR